MKNIKNYLLSFILGGIIFSGLTVFAEYVITADKIEYSANTSVKDKIDDLYTKVKPNYTGNTEVTPSSNTQTLYTNNKILNSNIIINAVPSQFVDISASTITNSSDIAADKVAFKADGTKLIGSGCVKGSFNHSANSDLSYYFPFNPSTFILMFNQNSDRFYYIMKNSSISSTIVGMYGTKNGDVIEALPSVKETGHVDIKYHLDGNHIYASGENGYAYSNQYIVYYIICK